MTATQTQTLSPAQRAWVTRRAKLTGSSAPIAATIVVRAPTPIVPDAVPLKVRARRQSDAEVAARAAVKARTDQTALVPATEFQLVEIDLGDDAVVGMGNRRFTVLAQNVNRVKLFYAPLLVTTECSRDYFERNYRPARQQDRKAYAEIVRRNIARADKANLEIFEKKGKSASEADFLSDGGVDAQQVLALLAGPKRARH